ncbi:DUF2946 family protein [Polaromonas sp.]|uniref:DUF2946 family protein n=1 Tax=Polaromonas sp. TaxID=1869339 RepID=UPI001D866157|nr:DUF2946 family protein [Polaromonas sp.]MBT9475036.1 DUF2946 family protein [Polaromonas sp.]
MDDIVRQAIAKWPNVPDCYGWLGLDARGNWYMRDDRAQAAGSFAASFSRAEAAEAAGSGAGKGSLLKHEKLVDFIQRNYEADTHGQWFFQNGPQRVYVELQATPLIWRVDAAPAFAVASHTGQPARVQRCMVDEGGRVYLETDVGFGLVHTQDMTHAADAVEQGLWVPQEVLARDLPARFCYVRSPQALQKI